MSPYVNRIARHLRAAEEELTREVRRQQRRWHYRARRGHVRFDGEVRRAHHTLKQSVPAFLQSASILNLLTTPIIYSLSLPFLLLDLWVTLYQWTCFPIYGIARVRRRTYFAIDRRTLAYLNAIEKANCMYCSYATGVIAYVREVAARTEYYWCPIKHARPIPAPHSHYQLFFDYGDAEGYHRGRPVARRTPRRRPRARPARTAS